MASNEDLLGWIEHLKNDLLINPQLHNMGYYNDLINIRIKEIEAVLWYRENEGDIDGFIKKLGYESRLAQRSGLYESSYNYHTTIIEQTNKK